MKILQSCGTLLCWESEIIFGLTLASIHLDGRRLQVKSPYPNNGNQLKGLAGPDEKARRKGII